GTLNDENTMVPRWCSLYWSSSGAATGVPPSIRRGVCVVGTWTAFYRQYQRLGTDDPLGEGFVIPQVAVLGVTQQCRPWIVGARQDWTAGRASLLQVARVLHAEFKRR